MIRQDKTRQVFILSIDDTNMLIYKNRKQKILLSVLHLQNNFNRRFSTQFKIMCQKLKQIIKVIKKVEMAIIVCKAGFFMLVGITFNFFLNSLLVKKSLNS